MTHGWPIEPKASEPVTRYYGVYLNEKGKRVRFVVRDKGKIPSTAIEVYETDSGKEAMAKAEALVEESLPVVSAPEEDPQEDLEELVPGMIAWHTDARGCHMAIILEVGAVTCKALFFTSNSNWGSITRRATKDELALAGFVTRKRTYLTAVVRPTHEFSPRTMGLPPHRVLSLFREFFGVRGDSTPNRLKED